MIERISPVITPTPKPNWSDDGHGSGHWEVFKFSSEDEAAAWIAGDPDATPFGYADMWNVFLQTGINELWRIFTGASTNTFTQPNTQIGIGDSSTAAAATQTDLQAATNKYYQTLDASGGLTVGANGGTTTSLIAQATIGGSNGNFAWNEMTLKSSVSSICLNRAVGSLGTKASGTTWIAKLTLTIS